MLRDIDERVKSSYKFVVDLEGRIVGESENAAIADAFGIRLENQQSIYDYLESLAKLKPELPEKMRGKVKGLLKNSKSFEFHGDYEVNGQSKHLHINGAVINGRNGNEHDFALIEISDESEQAHPRRFLEVLIRAITHDGIGNLFANIRLLDTYEKAALKSGEDEVKIPFEEFRVVMAGLYSAEMTLVSGRDRYKDMVKEGKINFAPHKRELNLRSVVDPLVDRLLYTFKVDNKIPRNLNVYADRTILQNIYFNLFRNIQKYGKNYVKVGAHEKKNETFCYIFNKPRHKPTNEDLKKIFNPSYRAEVDKGKDGDGWGLGITRKYVEAHNGRIYAKYKNGLFRVYFTLANLHTYEAEMGKK